MCRQYSYYGSLMGYLQYVAGTDNTVTWEEAPSAVEAARNLINERMKQALKLDYHFNEVLSAGYMEKQKMAVSIGMSLSRISDR